MNFRKIISVLLLICLIFSISSCKSGASTEKVVDNFMKALAEFDVREMAKYVEDMPSNADSVYMHDIYTEGYYVDLYQIANEDLFEYDIVSVKGNKVKVKVTMPDIYTLYQNTFMSVVSQTFSNEDLLEYVLDEDNDPQLMVIALMIDAIENDGIDTVEEQFTLNVGNINGEPKIMTNEQLEQLMTSKLSLTQKAAILDSSDDE